jgi:hypothetical protein
MISVAGFVVAQTSQRGGPDLSGDLLSTSSSSAGACEMRIVNGIVQQCCAIPYSAYFTCRQFSDMFNQLCAANGVQCSTVSFTCGGSVSHAINEATIDGHRCLVEPQGHIISCDIDTPQAYNNALCAEAGQPAGCSCSIRPTSSSVPSDYTMCGQAQRQHWDATFTVGATSYTQMCNSCCTANAQYHISRGDPTANTWIAQCQQSCDTYRPFTSCTNSSRCSVGFVGTCDANTCTQNWNSGYCNADGSCAIVPHRCDNSGVVCSTPNQGPCGGTAGVCGGSCGTPGWQCAWNPLASGGSCVCTAPVSSSMSSMPSSAMTSSAMTSAAATPYYCCAFNNTPATCLSGVSRCSDLGPQYTNAGTYSDAQSCSANCVGRPSSAFAP